MGRQIRLLTILPVPVGAASDIALVRCTMKIWTLPTIEPVDRGALPSCIISFDPCVTSPPEEDYVEVLREMLTDTLKELDQRERSLRSRAKNALLLNTTAVRSIFQLVCRRSLWPTQPLATTSNTLTPSFSSTLKNLPGFCYRLPPSSSCSDSCPTNYYYYSANNTEI